MSRWQPMETAPKDGTRILVWLIFKPPHRYYGSTRHDIVSWEIPNYGGEAFWHLPASGGVPMFWQPLPDAPLPARAGDAS